VAKKSKAVYAPGELAKTRGRLGDIDDAEAKRLSRILGGEVGYERTETQEAARHKKVRHETVEVNIGKNRPIHRVDIVEEDSGPRSKRKKLVRDMGDDPSVPVRCTYWERVRMDKYMGQMEFEIKSSGQILVSMLSLFGEPPDYVSPRFINRRLNDYYKRIELLVTSVRSLLPRNNLRRNERVKKVSPFVFSVLDTIRYWNIEQIASNLTRIQSHPRTVKISDLSEILRDIYKPIYILELLDPDVHIKGSFKLLYKILYLENPGDAKIKYQELIRSALINFGIVRRDIRLQLYPLLMKILSDHWIPYDTFFMERKNRIRAFLQVSEKNRINPDMGQNAENAADEDSPDGAPLNEAKEENQEAFEQGELSEEELQKRREQDAENKALRRGLSALEALFPKAGWERLSTFPDLYPYFSDVFHLKKGVELIAPTDPIQQTFILMRVMEELFFGLRYTVFGVIMGPDGNTETIDGPINRIINNWQRYTEASFDKEYLPRLDEYCRLLENSAESRTSNYAKRLINELHWAKRLYFLPYYKFESIMPPPFQKREINSIYPEIRTLRRYLTAVAGGIEQGNKNGGAEKHAPCDGIDNPWDAYVFQVPNPVSQRLDELLAPNNRNNSSLIYFSLSVAVVLDHLLNNENSWAYTDRAGFLFRSENGEGVRPSFGVDTHIDTEVIFKQTLKKRQMAATQAEMERKAAEINV
jgi:hypothetical protein